ncbi:MAG: response regulator transcription factor [Clostridioides sp.]|jgi:DNA-binding response OmpR family regulator|nr:response regulator transcription factor [Clostridioides sp.]
MFNILVADDEEYMLKILYDYLKKENMVSSIFLASDGEEALDIIYSQKIDIAILDWMMPYKDGISVCKKIKNISDTKVLLLTAKSEIEDEIQALSVGADDYIRKPFDPKVLILRMKKILRYREIIEIENFKFDFESRKIYMNEAEINLTKIEIDLLLYLVTNKGKILTRNEILDNVWGIDYDGTTRTVDTHIARLRNKYNMFDLIKTYRGVGYGI